MARSVLISFACGFLVFAFATWSTVADDSDLPPIKTEVKYAEDKEVKNDDPASAWEEWDETPESRKNPFPRRQRKIEVGMDVNTIMGMAMRQPKVVTAVLTQQFGSNEKLAQLVTQKFRNQMSAAGIGCRLWFVLQGRQVIANCETIRDGHMCKDYMIRQPEIMRTVLDDVPFTPKPTASDDDDDDEDDDDDDDVSDNSVGSKEERNISLEADDAVGSADSREEEQNGEKTKLEL